MIEPAQSRWLVVSAHRLVALVRAGAASSGVLVGREATAPWLCGNWVVFAGGGVL
jgi:hypothetical protein